MDACRSRLARSGAVALLLLVAAGARGDEIVARINGEAITRVEVTDTTRLLLDGEPATPTRERAVQALALRQLAERRLTAQKARELDIRVAAGEVDDALTVLKRSDPRLGPRLAKLGLERALRTQLEADLLYERVLDRLAGNVVVSPEEIDAAIADAGDSAEPSSTDAEQIREQLLLSKKQRAKHDALRKLIESAQIDEFVSFGVRLR